ncbi:hypothetical protein CLAFUW4_11125 [Fulvia fulva]|nr:uncharacterized protein CLAFUR5_20305 [Fulvia fulva]KAK4620161.1 hypothetical protein CLAFUR4_11130 [Fulvia fulva]KAK4620931.1 hypothetical protein CLAFUR0_11136 [Fulvia fulva]WMI38952.1 hypothetical protein CLAFUR5_20305 [Fulvia fulva]WPV17245.1 hypothetical protein CLAFUW4_11125 [Fulvia fulva]WPV32723.1 hypothetical protein CLAFUW7_11121 [Fulvia fulva]
MLKADYQRSDFIQRLGPSFPWGRPESPARTVALLNCPGGAEGHDLVS